jgi:hypothetical protein
MSQNIDQRLQRLRARRYGSDRSERVTFDQQLQILRKQLAGEAYEKRAGAKPYTRYALGAMQEVDPDYTRISIETAERVENQLKRRLASEGMNTVYRIQGSVPLNVHIRGVSDVDLLVIEEGTLYYANDGVRALRGGYFPATRDPIALLSSLRSKSETSLEAAFPAATVYKHNAKAIKLSGGSLPRPVDVVPALWWDTKEYQLNTAEETRGVSIYHKLEHRTINNLPFLHIKRVSDQDSLTLGGLRKAIRLCKNVKADAEEDSTRVELSSYEIAGLLYHANLISLRYGSVWELNILAEAQRHLDWCYRNPEQAKAMLTPDGSRKILDTEEKLAGLLMLSSELDRLLAQVAQEQSTELYLQESPSLERSREVLSQLVI